MWLKNKLKSYLDIQPSTGIAAAVREPYDHDGAAIRNRIWMRGEPYELEQFFRQSPDTYEASFWASVPTFRIRKIHSGIPSLMVRTLTKITTRDLNGIKINDKERAEKWEEIQKDNNFSTLLDSAVAGALAIGDGAFKISIDGDISSLPIVEWYDGDKVDFIYKRGRLVEIIFKTQLQGKTAGDVFTLYEHYGKGYINYELKRFGEDSPLDVSFLEQTKDLKPVEFGGGYIMAVPFIINPSVKYKGRGDSIFEGKSSAFDALDEILSQWADAVRAGRVKTYIPSTMVPRDPSTGAIQKPNPFDDRFIVTSADMAEGSKNVITSEQAEIRSEQYLQAYITYLDLALQGAVSPSTLGIDTKKLDNAEAQREKEKTTLYTRNKIIEALSDVIGKLVNVTLKTFDQMNGQTPGEDVAVSCDFGEYANPSFEAVVETVGKAMNAGIMSYEMAVDELYGDTLTEEEKAEEVARLYRISGTMTAEEPSVGAFDSERYYISAND